MDQFSWCWVAWGFHRHSGQTCKGIHSGLDPSLGANHEYLSLYPSTLVLLVFMSSGERGQLVQYMETATMDKRLWRAGQRSTNTTCLVRHARCSMTQRRVTPEKETGTRREAFPSHLHGVGKFRGGDENRGFNATMVRPAENLCKAPFSPGVSPGGCHQPERGCIGTLTPPVPLGEIEEHKQSGLVHAGYTLT